MPTDPTTQHPAAGVHPSSGSQPARHDAADLCSLALVVAVALALLLLVVAQRGPDAANASPKQANPSLESRLTHPSRE